MEGSVVVDANLVVALAVATPYSQRARELFAGWREAGTSLHAPLLLEYEVTSAVRQAVAAGLLPADQVVTVLDALWDLSIERHPPDPSDHLAAVRWAERLGQRAAYDAQYLALAERLGAEFYTADRRLATGSASLGICWVRGVTPEP